MTHGLTQRTENNDHTKKKHPTGSKPSNPLKVLDFGSCCVIHWCMIGSRLVGFVGCVRGSVSSLAVRRVVLLTSMGGCGGSFDRSDTEIPEPSDSKASSGFSMLTARVF